MAKREALAQTTVRGGRLCARLEGRPASLPPCGFEPGVRECPGLPRHVSASGGRGPRSGWPLTESVPVPDRGALSRVPPGCIWAWRRRAQSSGSLTWGTEDLGHTCL